MAAARKKTTKKAATRRKARVGKTWGLTAAQKRAAKRVKPRAEMATKKPRKRKSRATPVAAHPPSPRGGRPCKACDELHSRRQHGSHAEGPALSGSYKARRRKKAEASEKAKRSRAFEKRAAGVRASGAARAAASAKPKRRTARKARAK